MNHHFTLQLNNTGALAANEPEPTRLHLENTQNVCLATSKSILPPLCKMKKLISSHSDIYISNMTTMTSLMTW